MSGRKKILLVGPFPPPVGGDTVLTRDLAESGEWQKNGFTIVTVNASHSGKVRLPESRLSAADITRAARILMQVTLNLPGSCAVLLWANRRFLCTVGTAIIYLCNLFGKPVIAKAFGGSLGKRIKGMGRSRRRYVAGMLKRCRYLLPETEELTAELTEDIGIPRSQVRMMPNFLPERFFSGADPDKDKSFAGRTVFLGQIKREKGVFTIIRALEGRKGYSCDFFGPIVERDMDEFKGRIDAEANLAYGGVLSPADIPGKLGDYDALLLPTRHSGEGYPAVILQAFACGVPAIAADWLSIPDLIGDDERGLLIPPDDPGALMKALEKLSSDRDLRSTITENAREYARMYSEKRIIGDLLISDIIAGI